MKILKIAALAVVMSLAVSVPADAKKEKRTYVVMNEEAGVPVFPHDFTDRPYVVIKEVKAGVRKATIFSKESSQNKIYRELWERAEKLGADAVIKAQYGESHVSLMSWGKTNATGIAIRFTGPATADAPQN